MSGVLVMLIILLFVINYYWIKLLVVSVDGCYLYVGIGFNSNIIECGMVVEVDCVCVW